MTAWEIMEGDDEMKIIESGSLEKGHGWHSYIKVCGDVDDVKNANIIAAAPELLEALQQIVSAAYRLNLVHDDDSQLSLEVSKSEYSINKALGR